MTGTRDFAPSHPLTLASSHSRRHLGDISRISWPKNRGFDTSFGFNWAGLDDHFEWKTATGAWNGQCGAPGYDIIVNDTQPPGGATGATHTVNSRSSTWDGSPIIWKGEDHRPASVSNDDFYALYKGRAAGNSADDQTLDNYDADAQQTDYSIKAIREQAVARIDDHDQSKPFFMYVATPAMRGWSETNDAQRQTAFDLMQSKIDDCDHVDESNHPSGLNSRAMHKLKDVVNANGQSWSTVKQNYILNQYCTDSRKNVRFRLYAAAQSADALVNATTDALHRNGMWDNTLVILSSDNGGWPGYENFNWPFRGGKSTYFEGGIRMHTALSGGFLRPQLRGLVSNAVTSNIDWWPTLSWMAGLDPCAQPHTRTHAHTKSHAIFNRIRPYSILLPFTGTTTPRKTTPTTAAPTPETG